MGKQARLAKSLSADAKFIYSNWMNSVSIYYDTKNQMCIPYIPAYAKRIAISSEYYKVYNNSDQTKWLPPIQYSYLRDLHMKNISSSSSSYTI